MTRIIIRTLIVLVICAPYAILATLFWTDLKEKADVIKVTRHKVARFAKITEQIEKNDSEMPYYRREQGLLDNYLRSEILYREAIAFGLDKDDDQIKRRLADKMYVYFLELARNKVKIDKKDVLTFFRDHKDDYFIEPRYSFAHVYFSSQDKDLDLTESLASEKLTDLNMDGEISANAERHGEKFLYQANYRLKTKDEIVSHFGAEFADKITQLNVAPRKWYGPIQSRHGFHLVSMDERINGRYPRLQEVESKVRRDAEKFMLRKMVDKEILKLQSDYKISLDKTLPEAMLSKYQDQQKIYREKS